LLNKKGNSNQGDRWNLLNKIIEKIGHSNPNSAFLPLSKIS